MMDDLSACNNAQCHDVSWGNGCLHLKDDCDTILASVAQVAIIDGTKAESVTIDPQTHEPCHANSACTDLNNCTASNCSAVHASAVETQNTCVTVSCSTGRLSLSLVTDTETLPVASSLCPFSPQTPCSQFKSCVLEGVGHCAGIAGAALCRWDMIVGRKVVYIWATSAERMQWLARPDMLGFIAHFTVVSEVLRSPRNEAKFFASPSDGIVLASFLFDANPNEKNNDYLTSQSLMTHSISIVLPHSELNDFLRLKTVCLEWLGRTAMELRVRLAKVKQVYYYFVGENLLFEN
jgi:hypothetical protein